jgi:RimJ/RimL family protein N-acetyltransferase
MIELRLAPEPLGWVFLRPTEDGDWLELGYRLLPEAWGKGVAPEAASMLIDVAFDDWQAESVMALIVPENLNSRRVVEKLGFEHAGATERYYDERLDLWVKHA